MLQRDEKGEGGKCLQSFGICNLIIIPHRRARLEHEQNHKKDSKDLVEDYCKCDFFLVIFKSNHLFFPHTCKNISITK